MYLYIISGIYTHTRTRGRGRSGEGGREGEGVIKERWGGRRGRWGGWMWGCGEVGTEVEVVGVRADGSGGYGWGLHYLLSPLSSDPMPKNAIMTSFETYSIHNIKRQRFTEKDIFSNGFFYMNMYLISNFSHTILDYDFRNILTDFKNISYSK